MKRVNAVKKVTTNHNAVAIQKAVNVMKFAYVVTVVQTQAAAD